MEIELNRTVYPKCRCRMSEANNSAVLAEHANLVVTHMLSRICSVYHSNAEREKAKVQWKKKRIC